MSGVAVVASTQDAKFAEQVRSGLRAAGLDSAISTALPQVSGSYVVLIWSAALEAAHSIDAQALIGLWSEDRLVTVRRDATPLPLGLRDLPSLPPTTTVAAVCAAVPGAQDAIEGLLPSGEVEQISVGSTPALDDGQRRPEQRGREEVARREAEVSMSRVEAPGTKWPFGVIASLLIASAVVGGAWYYYNKGGMEKQAALTAALEQATKASEELKAAHAQQQAALKELEEARAAELAAIRSGDQARIKEAQEAARRAEAAAAKQAEAVKAREAAASDARRKAQESAMSAKPTVVAKAPEAAVAAAPATKATAEQVEAPKAETAKPEPAPVASAKALEPVAKSAEPPKAMSRSERERAAEEEAAQKATASAQVSAAPSSAPQAAAGAPSPASSAMDRETVYRQARALESEGNAKDAVRLYRRAARAGSGKAALRLGEIYDRGIAGIPRDYAESLAWYETARRLGEAVERPSARGEGVPAAVKSAPLVRERAKPAPVPAAKPASIPEPARAMEPTHAPAPAAAPETPKAAAPAPAPEPAKSAVPPPTPGPEEKGSWFSTRGIWIALLVLALIAWRRYRRRQKKAARQQQRALDAVADRATATRAPMVSSADRQVAAPKGDGTLFVSYSHKDRPRVEPIVSVIEEMGQRVWMDRSDITGKTGWAGQIVRAIRECRAVVLMASPNSYTSDQVVRELYLAMNHKKTIVPIEIEPAEMPDELQYILAPFHHHRLSGGEPRAVIGRALAAV